MIDRACISLSNRCNLSCRYCHFQDKQTECCSFTSPQLLSIADNIHRYCTGNNLVKFKLGIVGAGEPLLNSESIFHLLDHIRTNHYRELALYTISNGLLFTMELANQFLAYQDIINVCFSLDGYRELHNTGRMAFEQVMAAIHIYSRVFGHSPSINATVNLQTYLNKEKVIQFFRDNDLLNVTFSKLVSCEDKDLRISNLQFAEFMAYAEGTGISSRQFRQEKCYDCTMYGRLCGVGRTNIFITPEGVYPCGRFYKFANYRLGDWNEPLTQIETSMSSLNPVPDGQCYYAEYVEASK